MLNNDGVCYARDTGLLLFDIFTDPHPPEYLLFQDEGALEIRYRQVYYLFPLVCRDFIGYYDFPVHRLTADTGRSAYNPGIIADVPGGDVQCKQSLDVGPAFYYIFEHTSQRLFFRGLAFNVVRP